MADPDSLGADEASCEFGGAGGTTASSRVLLVEDDRETRELIERALSAEGYLVDSAARCSAGTEALRRREYSAVVLDVRLPDGSGINLCRQCRAAGIRVPVLMLTAWIASLFRHGSSISELG